MSALGDRVRSIPTWQVTLSLALFALGFLVVAQLRSEGPRVRYTTQERPPLVDTARTLQAQQDGYKDRILQVRAEIQALEQTGAGSAATVRDLNRELEQARIAAGLIALQGPGLVLQLEDAVGIPLDGSPSEGRVTARDVRTIVEELWLAGAEAVAINSERLTGTTAVLDIGGSILVNSAYLAPPYQVSAIGPVDLFERLRGSAGFVEFATSRAEGAGVRIAFAELPDVVVPAYAGTIGLRYARPDDAVTGEAP